MSQILDCAIFYSVLVENQQDFFETIKARRDAFDFRRLGTPKPMPTTAYYGTECFTGVTVVKSPFVDQETAAQMLKDRFYWLQCFVRFFRPGTTQVVRSAADDEG